MRYDDQPPPGSGFARRKLNLDATGPQVRGEPPQCLRYPWTERRTQALFEAIDELDDLSGDERDRLKKSIPDVIVESPRSETAALRFRKVAAKVGAAGGRVLLNVLNAVATDAVKKHLGL